MSRWPDKYVIGLTGNIATGKSLVRKMLEHLGAFGIDADGLTAQAMSKGAPAFEPVVEAFGTWVLGESGEINREALGRIVFADEDALARLEAIVHPVVSQAIDTLIYRATQPVVVIEAIKLLESSLGADSDAIWVVDAPEELRLKRLVAGEKLSEADARQRLAAQAPPSEKLAQADVVITNTSTFDEPWKQVQNAWAAIPVETVEEAAPVDEAEVEVESADEVEEEAVAEAEVEAEPVVEVEEEPVAEADVEEELAVEAEAEEAQEAEAVEEAVDEEETAAEPVITDDAGELTVERGGPGDAGTIAEFLNEVGRDEELLGREDVMLAFGQKAYFLATRDDDVIGLAGWQVENLITSVDEFYLHDSKPTDGVVTSLLEHVEEASSQLQSEVSLLFVSNDMPDDTVQIFIDAGYEPGKSEDLKVLVWREAASELQPPNTRLLTKRLREDRVLKPI